MSVSLQLSVNGASHRIEADPKTPLLYILRNDLSLNGPKFGCGLGQCGSCMVLINGTPSPSCLVPASTAEGKTITTLEGLAEAEGKLHPIQAAFVEQQAAQCGYCLNGMMIAAAGLLQRNSNPGESDIIKSLQGNLCRCGTHSRILRAVRSAAEKMNG